MTTPAPVLLQNDNFRVEIDPIHGGINRLAHASDPHQMNWVCAQPEVDWLPSSHAWGLGFVGLQRVGSIGRTIWDRAADVTLDGTTVVSTYELGGMTLRVRRELREDSLEETYDFTSALPYEHGCGGPGEVAFGIYVPFNDNYPSAAECVTRRCNAHLWFEGECGYACALRMGGDAPHLGLAMTSGALSSYSVDDRSRATASNVRGTLVAHPAHTLWQPGETRSLGWSIFWHEGWEDFFEQLDARPGFLRLDADAATCAVGESITFALHGSGAEDAGAIRVDGVDLGGTESPIWTPNEAGGFVAEVTSQGRTAQFVGHVTPPVNDLLAARARFIVERQQVDLPESALDGAFVPYDVVNQRQVLETGDWFDYSEGRERLGMGVFLATMLQRNDDPVLAPALERYYRFVCTHLEDSEGRVFDRIGGGHHRLYNYPWSAHLHLEMYRLTSDTTCLDRGLRTLRAYYREGGADFYAIGIPIRATLDALAQADRAEERAEMLALFSGHAAKVRQRGSNFPPHEVNFEQSIIGPAAIILLELQLATNDPAWLKPADELLRCLDTFSGRQPDHHLREIAIRHWDGYWFGGPRHWGDTLPHHWSALTAHAQLLRWEAGGDSALRHRAMETLRNNLCAFFPDGGASCAFLYPRTVNETPCRGFDPLANDQDWALVYWLLAERSLRRLSGEAPDAQVGVSTRTNEDGH